MNDKCKTIIALEQVIQRLQVTTITLKFSEKITNHNIFATPWQHEQTEVNQQLEHRNKCLSGVMLLAWLCFTF